MLLDEQTEKILRDARSLTDNALQNTDALGDVECRNIDQLHKFRMLCHDVSRFVQLLVYLRLGMLLLRKQEQPLGVYLTYCHALSPSVLISCMKSSIRRA